MGKLRLLLDTHVLLWAVLEPHKLPEGLRELVEDSGCELLVSAASSWEIGTKWRIGKLPGAGEVVQAGLWAVSHRDPFDRLLAAQALLLDLELASTDAIFSSFEGVRLPLRHSSIRANRPALLS
jgi:PIN domain nuclease of toxin-antitoxin system